MIHEHSETIPREAKQELLAAAKETADAQQLADKNIGNEKDYIRRSINILK